MPITISLQRTAVDRAEARVNEQPLAPFEPAALLVDQPLFSRCPVPSDPLVYGQRLFAALGSDTLRAALATLALAPQLGSLIAIQTGDSELAAIPWEYLHDGDEYLIFKYLFVREVPNAPLPEPPEPTAPWRLVVMGSDPLVQEARDPKTGLFAGYAPMRRLKVVQELDLLRGDLLRQNPPAPIRWQRIAPTRQALIDDLATSEPLLFHYTGHGDVENGTPVLCFDDGTGCMDPRPVADLAADLRGLTYFAFLNACRTADSREPGANLALALVRHGIPAVLGTQYQVLDEAAAHFARTFYRFLAAGQHPAQALYKARSQLKNQFPGEPREWAVPVLYLAQNYRWQVQRPGLSEALRPLEPPASETAQQRAPDHAVERFVGRNKELLDLARLFVNEQRRVVTIRGAGGMGKTALVDALAQRLRFHFRDGIVAISLFLPGENVPLRAATVRRSLADLLGIQHPAFDRPDAADAQELVLSEALRARKLLLLIWDNYETVLWRLGREESDPSSAPFDEEQRAEAAAVQRLVRLLADKGVHLLFTTRQSPIGLAGETFYPPAEQGHQLKGLRPEDSVALMRQYVGERIPSRIFLEQLAAAVGHSPLALRLATSRWAKSQDDEATFITNLRDELSKANDPAAQMYQQSSVEINVRLSLNALPDDLRRDFLMLSVVANPMILPTHGTVIWDLNDEQAHARLERLAGSSLLQGIGYDEERNRAPAYAIHPVIAQVAGGELAEEDRATALARYANWVAQQVNSTIGHGGLSYQPARAMAILYLINDILVALPHLSDEQRGWAAWQAAHLLRHFGRNDDAMRMIALAEGTARKMGDGQLLGRCHHERGEQSIIAGRLEQAMQEFDAALAALAAAGDEQPKPAILLSKAAIHETLGDLDSAMAICERACDIAEACSDRHTAAVALGQIAGILQTRGDLDSAMFIYQKLFDTFGSLGDLLAQSDTLYEMALVRQAQNELDDAFGLFVDVLARKQDLRDQLGISKTLNALSVIFLERGDLEQAMRTSKLAFNVLGDKGDRGSKAAALRRMGDILVASGDLDTATRHYNDSLTEWKEIGNVRGEAGTRISLAQLQFSRGQHEEAFANAQESLRLLEGLGAPPEIAQVRKFIADMEAAIASPAADITLPQHAAALAGFVAAALRGERPREEARAVLAGLPAEGPLAGYAASLAAALAGAEGAAVAALAAAGPLLAQSAATERADALVSIGDLARLLGDSATELHARAAAVAAFREAGENRETLVALSIALYNLAMSHAGQEDYAAVTVQICPIRALMVFMTT